MSEKHIKGIVLSAVVVGENTEVKLKLVSPTTEPTILTPTVFGTDTTLYPVGMETECIFSDVPIDCEKRNKERKQNEQNEQN